MSNDRHDDKRVSAAYQDLARDRAPEHLNRNILAKAAAARKPAYSRWIAWSRPAAWAATITLCLAITFELLREPAMDVSIQANIPAAAPVIEERKRDDSLATDTDRAQEPILAKDKTPAIREIEPSFEAADREMRQEEAESLAEFAVSDKTSLARSASKQSFNEPAPARVRAEEANLMSGTALSDVAEADESTCPAERRAIASDWLDCILELEAEGLDAAAGAERELLIDTFPDFKLP